LDDVRWSNDEGTFISISITYIYITSTMTAAP
jgi:hypothetical protein